MKYIRKWLPCIFFISVFPLFSQFQTDTLDIPGLKWQKLESEHFTIYFPEEIRENAERVANILEHVYGPIGKSLDASKPDNFPIILLNTTAIANGYVRSAPRYSLWYHLPTFGYSFGPGDWFTILATHETRHMVQMNEMDRGFTRLIHYLYGETGAAVMIAISVPMWFEEGDAVITETALTDFGRGRQPWFYRDLRAILLEGVEPSFYDAAISSMYGSFKDHFPNKYHLGFVLVTYARDKYGADVWSRIIKRTMNFPYLPLMINIAVKQETGVTLSKLYDNAMKRLKDFFEEQEKKAIITPVAKVAGGKNQHGDWTNYTWPHPTEREGIIALKYGLDDAAKIVEIEEKGEEHFLANADPLDNEVSYATGKIVWSEAFGDPVWKARQWADLVLFDRESGKKRRLTRGEHLFVPALSPDGERIAAVEFTPARKSSLVIVDSKSGKILSRHAAERGEVFQKPSWSEDGKHLVFVGKSSMGNALRMLDIETGKILPLTGYIKRDIANPVFYGNYIVLQAPYHGKDVIFAIEIGGGIRINSGTSIGMSGDIPARHVSGDTATRRVSGARHVGRIFKIVERPYGAYQPAIKNGKLYFSDYTISGFKISYIDLKSVAEYAEMVSKSDFFSMDRDNSVYPFLDTIVSQEQGRGIVGKEEIPRKEYPVSHYNPVAHPFNFHTWGILPTSTSEISAIAISNDIFGSLSFIPTLSYDFVQGTFGGGVNATITGIFPNIGISESLTQLSSKTDIFEAAQLSLIFPLNLSRLSWSRKLSFLLGIGYNSIISITGNSDTPQFTVSSGIFPVQVSVSFSNTLNRAKRDIFPLWGEEFYTSVIATPFNSLSPLSSPSLSLSSGSNTSSYSAFQFFGGIRVYLPGPFLHHNLRLTSSYFYEKSNYYSLSDPTFNLITSQSSLYPRGYATIDYNDLYRLSADYSFPLFYPDFALGPFLFFSRIKANLFYDLGLRGQALASLAASATYGSSGSSGAGESISFSSLSSLYPYSYQSVGIEITSEFMIFTLPGPIDWGVRFIYRINDNNFRIEETFLSFGFDF